MYISIDKKGKRREGGQCALVFIKKEERGGREADVYWYLQKKEKEENRS